jgi:hypothetical protein
MVVDFAFKRATGFRTIGVTWSGPWNEKRIQKEFEAVAKWTATKKLKTGRWVFNEPADRRWFVGIEVKGTVRGDGRFRARGFPSARVAQVEFDPEVVSARVVYHGLNDWLRWRKKDKEIKSVGMYREIYSGNPWRDPKAWSHTTIQIVVRP